MNKYERTPEMIVDLHGHTISEAQDVLTALLSRTDLSHVRIVTGKGNHSKGAPVIPDFVKRTLLRHHIHFTPAKLKDGGEGALEVYLA
jgi:DNA-nicking Smr family endonuclease